MFYVGLLLDFLALLSSISRKLLDGGRSSSNAISFYLCAAGTRLCSLYIAQSACSCEAHHLSINDSLPPLSSPQQYRHHGFFPAHLCFSAPPPPPPVNVRPGQLLEYYGMASGMRDAQGTAAGVVVGQLLRPLCRLRLHPAVYPRGDQEGHVTCLYLLWSSRR